jgi:hypothetical protein
MFYSAGPSRVQLLQTEVKNIGCYNDAMTLCMTALSRMTLGIMTLNDETLHYGTWYNDTWHNDTWQNDAWHNDKLSSWHLA